MSGSCILMFAPAVHRRLLDNLGSAIGTAGMLDIGCAHGLQSSESCAHGVFDNVSCAWERRMSRKQVANTYAELQIVSNEWF